MSIQRLASRLLPVLFLGLALAVGWYSRPDRAAPGTSTGRGDESRPAATLTASLDARSGQMVEVVGRITRVLADDSHGSRHQRFIIALGDGSTLLVAHNIDLAPRVPLAAGDLARVRGQYEWNDRGGVLHWTHHDPDGRRRDTGWIEHQGKLYR